MGDKDLQELAPHGGSRSFCHLGRSVNPISAAEFLLPAADPLRLQRFYGNAGTCTRRRSSLVEASMANGDLTVSCSACLPCSPRVRPDPDRFLEWETLAHQTGAKGEHRENVAIPPASIELAVLPGDSTDIGIIRTPSEVNRYAYPGVAIAQGISRRIRAFWNVAIKVWRTTSASSAKRWPWLQ